MEGPGGAGAADVAGERKRRRAEAAREKRAETALSQGREPGQRGRPRGPRASQGASDGDAVDVGAGDGCAAAAAPLDAWCP